MLLSYFEIVDLLQKQVVVGSETAMVNSSSVDVRLGPVIQYEARDPELPDDEMTVIELGKREAPLMETVELTPGEPFLLYPGQFVLAQTQEVFNLPLYISAEFRLKSSAGRMGLSHALAVWCDAGWNGSTLTLELHNISQHHIIALNLGDRIGQMIFHRHEHVPLSRSYAVRGNYNGDKETTAVKPAKEEE